MKKGETNVLSDLVPIILVLLVFLLILNFSTSTPLNLNKSFLSALGLGEEVDFTEKNEAAKNGFNEFINVLRQCSNYRDTECVCNVPLTGFFRTHLITATQDGIKVEIVKDKNKVTLAKENIGNSACYVVGDGNKVKSSIEIAFDEEGAYIPGFNVLGTTVLDKDILSSDNVYKTKDRLCFITDEFKEKVKKCEK